MTEFTLNICVKRRCALAVCEQKLLETLSVCHHRATVTIHSCVCVWLVYTHNRVTCLLTGNDRKPRSCNYTEAHTSTLRWLRCLQMTSAHLHWADGRVWVELAGWFWERARWFLQAGPGWTHTAQWTLCTHYRKHTDKNQIHDPLTINSMSLACFV